MCSRFLSLLPFVFLFALQCTAQPPLKVCADPDNLPYSNQAQQGFENRIAELLATNLHRKLIYRWSRMERGFIREIFNQGECDVLIEVPTTLPRVLTTRPYYSSSYVFVTREKRKLDLTSFDDPGLKSLKIGIQALEDSPPGHALARRGLANNIVAFESAGSEADEIIKAVANRQIDVAVVWGPLAGYFAKRQSHQLKLTPVPPFDSPGIPFRYEMSMGVRKGDTALHEQLTTFLIQHKAAIDRVLRNYGVPVVDRRDRGQSSQGGD